MNNSIEFQLEQFNKQIPFIFNKLEWSQIHTNIPADVIKTCQYYIDSYLKNNYGYLLSLAMRVNPFDPEASAVVRSS